jgi:urease accessory protein
MTLQAGAVLEYLPEQTIPYAQAAFQQHLHVQLGAGACVLAQEIVAPGRLARGEAFAYREYDSGVSITDAAGHQLVRERLRLRPGGQGVAGLGVFEEYTYLGTFYALVEGTLLPAALVERLHTLLAGWPGMLGGATQLAHGGIAVRVLGTEHAPVQQALHAVWDMLRQELLGYPAVVWRT